jgi:hypothetical protein
VTGLAGPCDMAARSNLANYKADVPPPNRDGADNAEVSATSSRPASVRGTSGNAWQPADLPGVDHFLQLTARAVRNFHTYPPSSPLCADAVAAAHKALLALEARDRLLLRISVHELLVDEVGVGSGSIVEQELVRRLRRERVAALEIDRAASVRELSRFCADLATCPEFGAPTVSFADRLVEHGVEKIVPTMARTPEVLEVRTPSASAHALIDHERTRRDALFATDSPADYLYPPDKGWIRLDPTVSLDTVSLLDLAILVDDPADVASMLLRLTDDDASSAEGAASALEQKFSDVATLFAALDPRLARLMFAKLSRAVLNLEPERRKDLLRRTILPGLLDGRVDGTVLRDFPDLDLAESLCLLLELETAAPDVVTAALERLELPSERRTSVMPLIEERLKQGSAQTETDRGQEPGIHRHAQKLIRVEAGEAKSFAEFAAFDLSVDIQTTTAITAIRDGIAATDPLETQLHLAWGLTRLEPNTVIVEGCLHRARTFLAELERSSRWTDLSRWVTSFRRLADELRGSRPDVADAVGQALVGFCTPERVVALSRLRDLGSEGRQALDDLVEAFGPLIVPSMVAALDDPALQAKSRSVVHLMCDHAKLFAPIVVPLLSKSGVGAARALVRVLGFGGAGYEQPVADQLTRNDEQTSREALRALARIGTPRAAAIVGAQIGGGNSSLRAAAEEALWHLPQAQVQLQVRELLNRREFVIRHPDVAARLIDRSAKAGADNLHHSLVTLATLRFRFWNRAVVRLARKAKRALEQ